MVAEIYSERKQKPQKAKPEVFEGRMHLSNVGVIKRNLVYIIGLPLDLADEDKSVKVLKPDFLILDSFFSEESTLASVERSRVQQTFGASNNLHRRLNALPPRVAKCIGSSLSSSSKPVAKIHSNNNGNQSRESCVGGGTRDSTVLPAAASCLPSCLSFEKDTSEQNVYAQSLPTQSKSMTNKDLQDFDDQQLKGLEDICSLPSVSCSISLQQNLNKSSYTSWQQGMIKHQSDGLAHSIIVSLHDKASFPMTSENLVSSNGFHNNTDDCIADLDRSFAYSNMSASGNGKFIHNAASVENYTTPDVVEDISKLPASIPPGFSAPSRAAPPGFPTSGRMQLTLDNDGLNKPGFDTRTSAPHHSSFDQDGRLQLLVQQSLYARQSLPLQDHSRNRIS
ncbi:hypothetical protein CRYUN_Cryun05aG0243700 [Craigia yunnanensis]